MLVLGLLLILGAALLTVGAIYDAGETATVEILGQTLTTTAAGVFVAGMVTMLLFLIGVWAIMASMGRARRKRAERKAAKREQRDSVKQLEHERAALREENERLARQLAEDTDSTRSAEVSGGAAVPSTSRSVTHEPLAPTGAGVSAADSHATATHHETATHPEVGSHADHATDASGDQTDHDRVIDHRSDLTTHDTTAGGRHRDAP